MFRLLLRPIDVFIGGLVRVMEETVSQSPERSLLVALLRRALFDFFGGSSAERDAAKEWMLEATSSDVPFSFGWVCDHLDMDAERVRKYVFQTKLTSNRPTVEWWMRNIAA